MHRKFTGRPSAYRQTMQGSAYWGKVKNAVKLRDGYKCRQCRSRNMLEVHHISYRVGNESIIGQELEHLEWLVCLCATCHTQVHEMDSHPWNPRNRNRMKIG